MKIIIIKYLSNAYVLQIHFIYYSINKNRFSEYKNNLNKISKIIVDYDWIRF